MTGNLTFSKFKAQEFDSISGLLCEIFDTTRSELELLYKEVINDFDKDGWHLILQGYFILKMLLRVSRPNLQSRSA